MLIGCCHCDETSESSTPSEPSEQSAGGSDLSVSESASDSQSASDGGSVPPGPCPICSNSNGYVPSELKLEWCLHESAYVYPPSGVDDFGNCYADYEGPFTVVFDGDRCWSVAEAGTPQAIFQDTESCCFASTEAALRSHDCASMATGPGSARAYVWFVEATGGGKQIVALIQWRNTVQDLEIFPDGYTSIGGCWYSVGIPEGTLDCFGTYELDFVSIYGLWPPGVTMMPGPGKNLFLDDGDGNTINSFPPKAWVSLAGGALPEDACDYEDIVTP